jgi:hypothetical protein
LRTWALASEPLPGGPIEAEALADHRLNYLDYEGPVSGDRGHVTRWDAGRYELKSELPDEVVVQLKGGRIEGVVSLRRNPQTPQRWVFELSS